MARKNERDRTHGERSTSSRGRKGGARKAAGGATRAAKSASAGGARKGVRKAAGARKGGSAGKTSGARKTSGAKKNAGGRKQAAKNARGKSEAREMAQPRASRGGAAGTPGRGRARKGGARTAATRRAGRASGRGRRRQNAVGRGHSASTQRALWIESADQHAERSGQTLATRNHDVIMQWAEERGAVPATIAGTEHDGRPGVLRFDFPNFARAGGRLRQVDWDEWFETFDTRNLVFLFQEQMKKGNQSNFFRLDSPEREEG